MVVAEANDNSLIDEKKQNKADVPSNPLKINSFLFVPQGDIPADLIRRFVINRLIKDLVKTISDIGIRPPRFLTHTLIRLKANALPTSTR